MTEKMERKIHTQRISVYITVLQIALTGGLMHVLKHVHSDAERFRRKHIDLKTLLKKTKTHTYRISVSSQKRIKMKTMTENIAGACVCSMRTEFYLRHNKQFYRFLTF